VNFCNCPNCRTDNCPEGKRVAEIEAERDNLGHQLIQIGKEGGINTTEVALLHLRLAELEAALKVSSQQYNELVKEKIDAEFDCVDAEEERDRLATIIADCAENGTVPPISPTNQEHIIAIAKLRKEVIDALIKNTDWSKKKSMSDVVQPTKEQLSVAGVIVKELEGLGYLDFDGGEQEERASIIEDCAKYIGEYAQFAIERAEEAEKRLLEIVESPQGDSFILKQKLQTANRSIDELESDIERTSYELECSKKRETDLRKTLSHLHMWCEGGLPSEEYDIYLKSIERENALIQMANGAKFEDI
jgi:hypothetical protein